MRVKLQPSGSLIVCFFDDYTISNKLGLNNMSDTVVSPFASQHLVLTSTLGTVTVAILQMRKKRSGDS